MLKLLKKTKKVEEPILIDSENLGDKTIDKESKHTGILKKNQQNIVERLDMKIEETVFAIDNLINITYELADHVDVQMDSINRVVNEISNYSSLAEEVFANNEN